MLRLSSFRWVAGCATLVCLTAFANCTATPDDDGFGGNDNDGGDDTGGTQTVGGGGETLRLRSTGGPIRIRAR